MNLLREYIRGLLTESIDSKIMSMIDKADEANYHVEIRQLSVRIYDGSKNRIAYVTWDTPPHPEHWGHCLDSHVIANATADEGLGPLAYDVAIEVTGGLMSDRLSVSDEAEAVWDHYMNNRADVNVRQLDITDDPPYLPQLTPEEPSDDCSQMPAYDAHGKNWHKSGLSKKISKTGTPVIDELRKRGMLYEK